MLDSSGDVEVVAFNKPFSSPSNVFNTFEGLTISDIIRESNVDKTRILHMRVVLYRGTLPELEIPMSLWGVVKPKAGTHVQIAPEVNGAAVGALLTAVIGAAAPTIASAILGSSASAFALALAEVGITILGMLLVNAIIPPTSTGAGTQADKRYSISGTQNTFEPYAPFPTCFGRRSMAPLRSARGYTETVGRDIYYVGRYTFGHGPVALESLRIGLTPITEFTDVQVEFLNVDEALTTEMIPSLGLGGRTLTSASASNGVATVTGPDTITYNPDDAFSGQDLITYTLTGPSGAQTFTHAVTVPPPYRRRVGRVDGEDVWEFVPAPNQTIEIDPSQIEVVGWRTGSETMSLYSKDIYEDQETADINFNEPTVRRTQQLVTSASVDISYNGLGWVDDKGRPAVLNVALTVEYKLASQSDTEYVMLPPVLHTSSDQTFQRYTIPIQFPAEGQYDIRINRTNAKSTTRTATNQPIWTALRSIQTGTLPSHPNISEIAIRIKATEQLNGQVDTLNGIARQIGRVWDGATWSAPQLIRHPAWVMAQAYLGGSLPKPLPDARLDKNALKRWADTIPDATCDIVVNGSQSFREVLDLIAATGRARRAMNDMLWSVVLDEADGPVVQWFTPRNSHGFSMTRLMPKEVHALRVSAVSERLEWQEDEIVVYDDGYGPVSDPGNNIVAASEFETLRLNGVVITGDDADQSNAWRLGRYHLAVAKLRQETFKLSSDLDHIKCQMGSKVRIVHDVPKIGIGQGRIVSFERVSGDVTTIRLDEHHTPSVGATGYRLRIRHGTGTETTVAVATTDGAGEWTLATPVVILSIAEDDLVLVEELTQESMDCIVTTIDHAGDLDAELTLVPAAPAVLQADTGVIPPYEPIVTDVPAPVEFGPSLPYIRSVISDEFTAIRETDGSMTPTIEVAFVFLSTQNAAASTMSLQWRRAGENTLFASSGDQPAVSGAIRTTGLIREIEYEMQLVITDQEGRQSFLRVPNEIARVFPDAPEKITTWVGVPGALSISLEGPFPSDPDVKSINIYAATAASTDLTVDPIGTVVRGQNQFIYPVPDGSDYTRYKIAPVDFADLEGELSDFINVIPRSIGTGDIAPDIETRLFSFDYDIDRILAINEEIITTILAHDQIEGATIARAGLSEDITNESVARATQFLELGASIDGNAAAIASEKTARVDDIEAVAVDITTLSATLGDQSATLTSAFGVAATAEGDTGASVMMRLVAGNANASYGFYAYDSPESGPISGVVFDADNMTFNGNWAEFFSDVTINGNLVVTGTVTTEALVENAATRTAFARSFGNASIIGNQTDVIIASEFDIDFATYVPVQPGFIIAKNPIVMTVSFNVLNNTVGEDYVNVNLQIQHPTNGLWFDADNMSFTFETRPLTSGTASYDVITRMVADPSGFFDPPFEYQNIHAASKARLVATTYQNASGDIMIAGVQLKLEQFNR